MDLSLLGIKSIDQIEKVYSGRSGCMCGCRGNYYEEGSSIRRVLANMAKFVKENEAGLVEDEGIIVAEANGKHYVVYLKA